MCAKPGSSPGQLKNRATQDHRHLETRLQQVVEQTADIVMITDVQGRIEYVNPAFEHVTGYQREEVLGKSPRILRSGKQDGAFYSRMWQTISQGKAFHDTVINRRKDGRLYYEDKTITPLLSDDGEIVGYVSTGRDITHRLRFRKRLNFLANHDPLTQLPNRQFFAQQLDRALARATQLDYELAIICLDIDRFHIVNRALNTSGADEVLVQVARRLQEKLRAGDLMARLDGDRFVILLEGLGDETDALHVARQLQNILQQPFSNGTEEVILTASFGIGFGIGSSESGDEMLHHAEEALQHVKQKGGNGIELYQPGQGIRSRRRLTLQTRLHQALERKEFVLHYQPQICATTRRIMGVEALLRWAPPDQPLVAPADFIPLLEETGLIAPVGAWIIDHACAQLRHWRDQGLPVFTMAVNISPRQLHRGNLLATVHNNLERHGLQPSDLHLEVTESLLIQEDSQLDEIMHSLAAMGTPLSIDDFGTGYSSLAYLRRFPFRTLKLDRRFIAGITEQPENAAIVTAVIQMAHALNIQVIAEGVENVNQARFLRNIRCNQLQGFYFSRPQPAARLMPLLRDGAVPAS